MWVYAAGSKGTAFVKENSGLSGSSVPVTHIIDIVSERWKFSPFYWITDILH